MSPLSKATSIKTTLVNSDVLFDWLFFEASARDVIMVAIAETLTDRQTSRQTDQ